MSDRLPLQLGEQIPVWYFAFFFNFSRKYFGLIFSEELRAQRAKDALGTLFAVELGNRARIAPKRRLDVFLFGKTRFLLFSGGVLFLNVPPRI